MWLLGRLVPDHKTVADFRKDNGPAKVRALCRAVSREGSACESERCDRCSKFKAANTRARSFSRGKVERRQVQLEKCFAPYLTQLDTANGSQQRRRLPRRPHVSR